MRYRIDDTVVDTDNATATYQCRDEHDGRNRVCVHTGSQWEHQMLYRSRRGRYYLAHLSSYQGSRDYAEWLSPEAAARWLVLNESGIPEELAGPAETVTE